MKRTLIQAIASKVAARENCLSSVPPNTEWYHRHTAAGDALAKFLPSGSGFDSGTKIDWDKSRSERLVFTTSYHHMNENGMYDGWTDHTVIVSASLPFGIDIRVTGVNRNDIKEYIGETFQYALTREGVETVEGWKEDTNA